MKLEFHFYDRISHCVFEANSNIILMEERFFSSISLPKIGNDSIPFPQQPNVLFNVLFVCKSERMQRPTKMHKADINFLNCTRLKSIICILVSTINQKEFQPIVCVRSSSVLASWFYKNRMRHQCLLNLMHFLHLARVQVK